MYKNRIKTTIDKLRVLIEEIKEENALIVVEGKNDKKSLEELGFTNIKPIAGKPQHIFLNELLNENSLIVILTDLDKEGRKQYGRICEYAERNGLRVDMRLRKVIAKLPVKQIESLANFLSKYENEYC